MLRAIFLRVGFFKIGDEFPADESGAVDHRRDRRIDLEFVRLILRLQVNKWDMHGQS